MIPLERLFAFRGPALLGAVALLLLVFGFGYWSVSARLAGAVIAPGIIEVEQNRQSVQHPDGGVLTALLVAEGELVVAGQPLARLDDRPLLAELAIARSRLGEIRAHRARLEAERDSLPRPDFPADADDPALIAGQAGLFQARHDSLKQETAQLGRRRAQIAAQIEGLRAQSRAVHTQLDLIRQELASQRSLKDRGLAQAAVVLGLEREEARLLGMTGQLVASEAEAGARITEVELQITRLRAARHEEAASLLRDIAPSQRELEERISLIEARIDQLEIRAPASGQIMGLALTTPRAVLRPAEVLLQIVPRDRPMIISARIAPGQIEQIHPGQIVRLHLAIAGGRNLPERTGILAQISADTFIDPATRHAYYRAEITLDHDTSDAAGPPLLPGMPVEAYIGTQSQSPLAYLTEPFAAYFRRALREG